MSTLSTSLETSLQSLFPVYPSSAICTYFSRNLSIVPWPKSPTNMAKSFSSILGLALFSSSHIRPPPTNASTKTASFSPTALFFYLGSTWVITTPALPGLPTVINGGTLGVYRLFNFFQQTVSSCSTTHAAMRSARFFASCSGIIKIGW